MICIKFYSLGNSKCYSIKEVIDIVEKVIGLTANKEITERRAEDPAILIAISEKVKNELK